MTALPDNACNCEECRQACEFKPGWFRPEQIEPLARALGFVPEELFSQHLSVDWWAGDVMTGGKDIFVLSPRLATEAGGGMFPANPHGQCHWYKDGRCEIHHLGKPAECAFAHHGTTHADYLRHRLAVVNAWATHQDVIEKLLGRTPTTKSFPNGTPKGP